jgi:hypothetical protein
MSRPICANTTHALKEYLNSGIRTCKRDLRINASRLLCRLVYEGTWASNRNIVFTSLLLLEDSDKSSTLIPDFLQIRQTCWCLCLPDVRHKTLQLMEGIDKTQTGKYKEITNDWNYDASCTLTSLPVWDLENFKRLIFIVESVQSIRQTDRHSLYFPSTYVSISGGISFVFQFSYDHHTQ